jgi:hypothetical protein
MKKVTGLAGMLLVAGVAVALGYVTTGFGKSATASTVTARVSGFTARTLSVYNAGTNETVFALVNSTTITCPNCRLPTENVICAKNLPENDCILNNGNYGVVRSGSSGTSLLLNSPYEAGKRL